MNNHNHKNASKYSPDTKNNQASLNNLQPINSQRNKISNTNIYNKYNKKYAIDITKNENTPNKYRIITEPVDNHIMQLTKSYSRLSKPKNKQIKIQSQHNSIRSRQKTISSEKFIQIQTTTCLKCHIHEKQMSILTQQIENLTKLKNKWKNGGLLLTQFQRATQNYIEDNLSKACSLLISEIRQNMIDLMRDIEALTEIDHAKLFTSHSFDELYERKSQQYTQLKGLFLNLKNQVNGYVTQYDFNQDGQNQNMKMIIRNLKTNLANSLRKNLEFKTISLISKRQDHITTEDIYKIVSEILKGIKKGGC